MKVFISPSTIADIPVDVSSDTLQQVDERVGEKHQEAIPWDDYCYAYKDLRLAFVLGGLFECCASNLLVRASAGLLLQCKLSF